MLREYCIRCCVKMCRSSGKSRLFPDLVALAMLTTLGGCVTVGPDYVEPDVVAVEQRQLRSDPRLTDTQLDPAHQWWSVLDDPMLEALVMRSFRENRDLAIASANIAEAKALLRIQRTNFRPTGELTVSIERQRQAGATFGLDEGFGTTELYTVGASAVWELDFFGRIRRANQAALADLQADEALRRDAETLVAAETARAYFQWRGASHEKRVAERNLDLQRRSLRLTERRFLRGFGSRLDVERAGALMETTTALIPPLEAAQENAANRLATLTNQSVEEIMETFGKHPASLALPPTMIAIGDPRSLLRRRADIRAAERSLSAATARIGVAEADFFPQISLVGNATTAATELGQLGSSPSIGFGIGPSLSWSGFDIPLVQARVEAADARAGAALARYEQTVLTALEETQSALANYGREHVRYTALKRSVSRSEAAARIARRRFVAGLDDFLVLLVAETNAVETEAALARSRTLTLVRFAELHRALGAGWDLRDDLHR